MVDSRDGSATVTVANSGRDDVAQRLHLVLGEQLGPIRESLEAAGQNLAGLRERFASMEAALGGLVAATDVGAGHAVCAAKLGEARRAVEELAASSEAGRRLREDNAVLRRDLELQRGRHGIVTP